jgi:stress response protein YsnF
MTGFAIGLLESREVAQRVRAALVKAGSDEGSVVIFGGKDSGGVVQELVEHGFAAERARLYAEAVGRGGVLVVAEAEDTDKVLAVMDRFDVKEPEELLERGGEAGQVERAQSVEEELRVGKEQTTAGKRLVSSVSEREVEKPVTLREEEVAVERRREDRRLSPGEADRAFREETVEVSATSERPVVSKEARVTGEVELRKRTGEREEVVRDTLRSKDVEVETVKEQPKQR